MFLILESENRALGAAGAVCLSILVLEAENRALGAAGAAFYKNHSKIATARIQFL